MDSDPLQLNFEECLLDLFDRLEALSLDFMEVDHILLKLRCKNWIHLATSSPSLPNRLIWSFIIICFRLAMCRKCDVTVNSCIKPTVWKLMTLVQIWWVLQFMQTRVLGGLIWKSISGQIEVANSKFGKVLLTKSESGWNAKKKAQKFSKMKQTKLENFLCNHGYCCQFLPKYHCELNPIERCWAQAKQHSRVYCNYNIIRLRRNIPERLDMSKILTTTSAMCMCIPTCLDTYLDSKLVLSLKSWWKRSQTSTGHTATLLKTSRKLLIC